MAKVQTPANGFHSLPIAAVVSVAPDNQRERDRKRNPHRWKAKDGNLTGSSRRKSTAINAMLQSELGHRVIAYDPASLQPLPLNEAAYY